MKINHSAAALFLIVLAILPACTSSQKGTVGGEKELLCKLERTPCFGKCPIYSISLYSDKTVFYEGKRFVDSIGSFSWLAVPSAYAEVVGCLKVVRQNRVLKQYPLDQVIPTDLPSTRLTFMQDDSLFTTTLKTREVPPALLQLAKAMDGLGVPH